MAEDYKSKVNKLEEELKETNKDNLQQQWKGNLENDHSSGMELTDGGWGWFIVVSSMVIHLIVAGLNRAAGILYLRFTEKFDRPASITAWVTSLSVSLTLGIGPIASALCNQFSYRKVVVTGGFILGFSMVVSGLSPNLYVLFASYGILGGVGKAFAYGPGVVIVGLYFDKRRSLAVGLATSGVALGAFVIPSVVEISFTHYGYFGAFLIMTGIAFQMIVCGFLLRPFSLQRRFLEYERRKIKAKHLSRRNGSEINGSIQDQDQNDTMAVKSSDYLEKDHNGSLVQQTNIKNVKSGSLSEIKKFDIKLLKNVRFFGLCVAILFFNVSFQSAMIFLPALSKPVGIVYFESFPVVVVGVCDGVGRILSGILFDRKCILPFRSHIYNFALFAQGTITFFIPCVKTPVQLGLACAFFGLFLGNGVSQQSVIIIDILGEQNLSCGFGILLFFQGIGTFIGPPISGLMKDINGTYDFAFYIGAVCGVIGASVFFSANIVHRKLQKDIYFVSSP